MQKSKIENQIEREIRKMGKIQSHPAVFERAWTRIEERLAEPKTHWVWRPWGHPVRWVAMAACLFLALSAYFYQGNMDDNSEIATHLINVSNPMGAMVRDQNLIKVSTLLSDSSPLTPAMTDEVQVDELASDAIFL
ncbi:MAG TPA: hypothetical protein VHE12_10830 [bacterium]|nr:hypothetical protein [bacterium]